MFLVGLFSMLDALLGVPMPVLVQQLDLSTDVAEALMNRAGVYGSALTLVESYEGGAWPVVLDQCSVLGCQPDGLRPLYTEAIQWARTQLRSSGSADSTRTPTPTSSRIRQGSLARSLS